MRHVSWRYGELGSSAMSRQPVGSWGFPGPCSTAGKIDMSATVEMGFTHDVKRRAGGVPTACRSRTSRRFWRWHCLIPPADLASMRCNWLDSTDSCRPARSIERCDAWIWELGSSDSSSWNDTVLSEPVCSRSARDGNCSAPVARGGMWKPTSRVNSSVWTPSTSVDSKGWGKVWQITACDAACSYAAARIIPANTAEHAVRFLVEILLPLYEAADWSLQRVLTDRGSEFKGAFDEACQSLGIRHTRTKPRHAWTNGFVERLQGTILHEHWRVAFRRRYFTARLQLDSSLQRYLAFYNDDRPHQGYRTRGRIPSDIFWGLADGIPKHGD